MSYNDTARALDELTDHVAFERLVTLLLARKGIDVRPVGGSGDKGRDAVSGLYRAKVGEELAVTISLDEKWNTKIAADINKLTKAGYKPPDVISVTNRRTSEPKRSALQTAAAKDHKINLTINDVRWLVVQLHLRENLDLRGKYLQLPPPRPAFFMDIGEYAQLLERRGLLSSQFVGREDELAELERLLTQGVPVVLEAAGGLGKTRLAFELARSGNSDYRWFFVDADRAFSIDYVAKVEAGYEAAILIDDAHRRRDLAQLVAGLEQRAPIPRLVFTVRPGHAQSVMTQLGRFAFPRPETITVQPVGRSALARVLTEEPYQINEGLAGQLIALSEGSIAIALIGAELIRAGADPSDLAESDLFAEHASWRLAGADLDDRQSRGALALVAALGSLNLGEQNEARIAREVLEDQTLARRLDELADAGLVIEEESQRFTVKPDILREHLFRSSFFPGRGRPIMRYEIVYSAFAPTRLPSLLTTLGDSRADLASGSNAALTHVRGDLLQLVEGARTPSDLADVAELVRRLGAAAGGIAVAERILEKIEAETTDDVDPVGTPLVAALSASKFGLDQLERAWELLLRLTRLAFARDLTETREAALTEIRDIYSAAPINYSSKDPYILAYVQHSVRAATERWWAREGSLDGAADVAATVVEPAFHLQLESHRQSTANAMSITLTAAYLPVTSETEALLRLGVKLFQESLPKLGPKEQLQLVERMSALGHVAGGYSGLFGLVPDKSLQTLAAKVLSELEVWLVERLATWPLPVAAEVMFHFAMRDRWPKRVPRVKAPRAKGDLRIYLELVDGRSRALHRLEWEQDLARTRERARRYGAKIGKSKDWQSSLQRVNRWVDEHEALTGKAANSVALDAMLAAAGEAADDRAVEIASYVVGCGLALGRFSNQLLERIAADKANWPLIQGWAKDASPAVRTAAVNSAYNAPDVLAKKVLTELLSDPDPAVAGRAFQVLLYGAEQGPLGWRFKAAVASISRLDEPLAALDQLLSVIRYRNRSPAKLTASQKQAVRGVVLASAKRDSLPSRQQLLMTMQELEQHKIDVVFNWVRARLAYLRSGKSNVWFQPLPDEIAQLIIPRRRTAEGKRLLSELLAEVEKESTKGAYRMAVDTAIEWLGRDSAEVTKKVGEWITGTPRLRDLAVSFVMSSDWRVYTKRVKVVIDARPNDRELAKSLVGPRFPRSWIGNMSKYYNGQADRYRQWTRSRDPRLRQLGLEAVAGFEELAAQEEASEQRLRDGFG
jgi:hypothetical protein